MAFNNGRKEKLSKPRIAVSVKFIVIWEVAMENCQDCITLMLKEVDNLINYKYKISIYNVYQWRVTVNAENVIWLPIRNIFLQQENKYNDDLVFRKNV